MNNIKRKHPESEECKALWKWAKLNKLDKYLIRIDHGLKLNKGTAMRLKAEGLISGIPDYLFVYPKQKTLWIEMKAKNGKQSESQKQFQQMVTECGFTYVICYSWVEAAEYIKDFIT